MLGKVGAILSLAQRQAEGVQFRFFIYLKAACFQTFCIFQMQYPGDNGKIPHLWL